MHISGNSNTRGMFPPFVMSYQMVSKHSPYHIVHPGRSTFSTTIRSSPYSLSIDPFPQTTPKPSI